MTELERAIEQIRRTEGCEVWPPRGQPTLRSADSVPEDLADFYRLCGGVHLFRHSSYPFKIVGPEEFVRTNPEIVGMDCPDDISDSWYIVGRGGREEVVSIDCAIARLGRCYDSFWDRHGVAGDCRVVAKSFTELIRRLLDNRGGYWYWLVEGGVGYGDAYDE